MALFAFPTNSDAYQGMELRDYIATHIMAAYVGASLNSTYVERFDQFATKAYTGADALLKAREEVRS